MAARRTATKKAAAKPPVEEPEELLEDEEFEEVEEGDVEEAPAAKKAGKGRPSVDFGIRHVCEILSKKTGKTVEPRELRTLARRLARDEQNQRIDREIVAGNRTMYSWDGPNHPEVKALIAAYLDGEGEIEKKAKLDALKASKASKTPAPAAKKTTAKKAATKKPAAPVEVDEDDEELDFDEED